MRAHIKSFLINLFFNTLMLGSALVTGVILARTLGPEGRGLYATVVSYAPFLGGILSWGFINQLSIEAIECDQRRLVQLKTDALWIGIAASAIGTLVMGLICFAWQPGKVYYGAVTFGFSSAWLAMNLITYFLTAVERGREKWMEFNIVKTIFYPLNCLGLILLWRSGLVSIRNGVVVYLAANLLGFLLCLVFSFRSGVRPFPDLSRIWQITVRAKNHALFYYSQMGVALAEGLLVILTLPPKAIGHVTVALSCAAVHQPITYSLGHLLFVNSALKNPDAILTERSLSRFRVIGFFNFIFYVLLGFVVCWAIPLLYGSDFANAVPLFWILMPGMLVSSVTRLIDEVFAGMGRPEVGMENRLYGLFLSIFLCVSGAYAFGGVGYAAGYSAAHLLRAVHYLYFIAGFTRRKKIEIVKLSPLDIHQAREFLSAIKSFLVARHG